MRTLKGWIGLRYGLLLAALTFSLSPAMAEEGYGFSIAGKAVTAENVNKLDKIPGVTVGSGGELKYDPASNTLTMKNVSMKLNTEQLKGKNAVHNKGLENLKLDVQGKNEITTKGADCFELQKTTLIKGSGELTLTAEGNNSAVHIPRTTLTVADISLSLKGVWGVVGEGHQGGLTIQNATVTTESTECSFGEFEHFNLQDCRIVEPEGASWHSRRFRLKKDWDDVKNAKIRPSYGFSIAGTEVTAKNVSQLGTLDGVTLGQDGALTYDRTTQTLTMKNVTMKLDTERLKGKIAIRNEGVDDLKIVVSGNNSFFTKDADCFRFDKLTTMTGAGTVTAKADATHSGVYLTSMQPFTIADITFNVEGGRGILGHVETQGSLALRNATLHAKGSNAAINLKELKLERCQITTAGARWDGGKHAVMKDGDKAKDVEITPFYGFYIAGTPVTTQNADKLNTLTGITVPIDGELKYDPATKTLKVKNVTIKDLSGKNALHNESHDDLTIEVSGTNNFSTKDADCFCFDRATVIAGKGTLTAKADGNNSGVYLRSDITLTLSNLTFTSEGKVGIWGDGGNKGTLVISKAIVHAKGTDAAINLKDLTLEESRITTEGATWNGREHAVMKNNEKAKDVEITPFYGFYIAGTPVTPLNVDKLNEIVGVTVPTDGELKYDPESKTLTMKGVTMKLNDDALKGHIAIHNTNLSDLKIDVQGKNQITTKDADCFQFHTTTSIKGTGELTLTAEGNNSAIHIPRTDLTIADITLSLNGVFGVVGADNQGALNIQNATVTTDCSQSAFNAMNAFNLTVCRISEPEGAYWNSSSHQVFAGSAIVKKMKIEPFLGFYIAGTPVTSQNMGKLSKIAGVTVPAEGELKYDPATKTLTMKNVTVKDLDRKIAFHNQTLSGLTIVASGINHFSTKQENCLRFDASTRITGEGTLTAKADATHSGVYLTSETTLDGATMDVEGKTGFEGNLDHAMLKVKNARVNIKGSDRAIQKLDLVLEGSKIVVPDGGTWNNTQKTVMDGSEVAKRVRILKESDPFEAYHFSIAGVEVTSENVNQLDKIPGVTLAADGALSYDKTTKTLTMKNVTMETDGVIALHNRKHAELKIAVDGLNKITTKGAHGVKIDAPTTLEGEGTLAIQSDDIAIWAPTATATLTLSKLTLYANGRWGLAGDNGTQGELVIKDATVNAKGTEGAIGNFKTFTLTGSKIVVPNGGAWKDEQHAVMNGTEKAKTVKMVKEGFVYEEYELFIAGEQVTSENCNKLKDLVGVSVTEEGEFKYDNASRTLTMKNVTLSCDKENAIYNKNISDLTIDVAGNNTLVVTEGHVVRIETATTVKGEGTLTARSLDNKSIAVWVYNGILTIEKATLNAYGTWGLAGNDAKNGALVLKNARVQARGRECAMGNFNVFTQEGCHIIEPQDGKWDDDKHAIVSGNEKAKRVWIVREGESPKLYGFSIAGVDITSENITALDKIPGVTVPADGELKYDPETKTLSMKNVTMRLNDESLKGGNAIDNKSLSDLKIDVQGKNEITTKDADCFQFHTTTSIKGTGELTLTAEGNNSAIHIPRTDLTIADITLSLTGVFGVVGEDNQGALNIQNATVTTDCSESAFKAMNTFNLTLCRISEPEGANWNSSSHQVFAGSGIAKKMKIEPFLGFYIAGTPVTSQNVGQLNGISGVTVAADGELTYASKTKTLTMKNVTITDLDRKIALHNELLDGFTIVVAGTNNFSTKDADCLRFDKTTTTTGMGALTAKAEGNNSGVYLRSDITLTLSNLTFTAEGKVGILGDSGNKGTLVIRKALVQAKGADAAIYLKDLKLEESRITTEGARWVWGKHAVVKDGEKAKEVKIEPFLGFYIAGEPVTLQNVGKLNEIVGVNVPADGELKYDPESKTLSMKNVTIKDVDKKLVLHNASVPNLTIEVTGNNEFTAKDAHCLRFDTSTTITGKGTMTAKADIAHTGVSLTSEAILTLSGLTFSTDGGNGILGDNGTHGTLVVRKAIVNAKGASAALHLKKLQLEECKIVTEGAAWNDNDHAVMKDGRKAKEVTIKPHYGLYIAGVLITPDNVSQLTAIPGVRGELKYDLDTRILSMKDVTITLDTEALKGKIAIHNENIPDLTIEVSGNNTLTAQNADALRFDNSATITGNGKLSVTTSDTHSGVYLTSEATLTLNRLTVSVEGGVGVLGDNSDHGTLIVRKATVLAKGKNGAITLKELKLEGSKIVTEGAYWNESKHAVMKGNEKAKEVEISKIASQPIFSLEPTTLAEVPAAGGKPSVTVSSDKAWRLTIPADAPWVTPSATSGTGDLTLTFEVAKNEMSTPRSTTVTFTQEETNSTLSLEIKQAALYVPLTGISFSPDTLPIKVGGSTKLKVTYEPENATNKAVTWAVTEGEASLTVDQEGNITATQVAGTAKVTATSQENSTLTATCTVNVITDDVPVESVEIIPSTLELSEGQTQKLEVKILPQTATDQTKTWRIKSGSEFITLTDDEVKGIKVGEAEVEVTVGGKSAVCKITVTPAKIPVESVKIKPATVTLTVMKTQQLEVIIEPKNATDQKVTWTLVAGNGIVTLSETGLVKAVKKGTATVKATVDGKSATCTVTVTTTSKPGAVEDAALATVVVAPNPFTSRLRVINPEGTSAAYELVTLSGLVLRAGVLGGIETDIDTANLAAGLYFVRLTSENGAQRTVRVVRY